VSELRPRIDIAFRDLVAEQVLEIADARGGYVLWSDLEAFTLRDGTNRRLVDPGRGGIWNPSDQDATLSIITSPDGPYADRELAGGLLKYSYQSGPVGGKNLKLRRAMELGLPVLRFHKIGKASYVPIYPVYVIGDDQNAREFTLAVDESLASLADLEHVTEIERRYAERLVRQRVHQRAFRATVMRAYEGQCAICVLKKPPLLDAAHIVGDGEEAGQAVVQNGLSLCKIHHAAYDQDIVGITPEYRVELNQDLLDEVDGPMLKHGLQEMHGRLLVLPQTKREHPDPARLEVRYSRVRAS
jgi:putative restriction endonuclease